MIDPVMETFLDGVVGVVEATAFEYLSLWRENLRGNPPRKWEENLVSRMATVGRVGDMPVCIHMRTAYVDGLKFLFIEATSQVVDHRMIENFLKAALPQSAFREDGYINMENATNFHNVFSRVAA